MGESQSLDGTGGDTQPGEGTGTTGPGQAIQATGAQITIGENFPEHGEQALVVLAWNALTTLLDLTLYIQGHRAEFGGSIHREYIWHMLLH